MSRGLPKKRSLNGVNHVVLVASGKGGVGKSTTAVNLALAMASSQPNLNIGVFDADIYGPSIPIMLNVHNMQPLVNDNKLMVPLSNYGLKCMSMGFLVQDQEAAVIWRGPMVMGATEKMLFQTDWSPLDVLVIDMPPGTGDIHLSIAQTLSVSGAVVVSTPQKVALADAKKGITMFKKVNIPVLGLVENMNAFVCSHCHETTHIFGQEGAKAVAAQNDVPLLGSVPLDPEIMRCADDGVPIVVGNKTSKSTSCYVAIADKLLQKLDVQ